MIMSDLFLLYICPVLGTVCNHVTRGHGKIKPNIQGKIKIIRKIQHEMIKGMFLKMQVILNITYSAKHP